LPKDNFRHAQKAAEEKRRRKRRQKIVFIMKRPDAAL
jgi:hypothetical protein